MRKDPLEEGFVERLAELPFVTAAMYRDREIRLEGTVIDAVVELQAGGHPYHLLAERKRGRLTRQLIDVVELWTRRAMELAPDGAGLILLADHVTPAMGTLMAQRNMNFVDLAGNCRLWLGDRYFAQVEGRKPAPLDHRKARVRPAAYQVQFALLANPQLARGTARALAKAAGVGKTAAAEAKRLLLADGFLGRTTAGYALLRRPELLERWLVAYADALRPRLRLGRYTTPHNDPLELEKALERALDAAGVDWAFGGGAGAHRLVGHYRGPRTVVHMFERLRPAALRALRTRPDDEGDLVIYKAPGRAGLQAPVPHVAHPLLIYAELLAEGDERAREVAALVREQYLQ